MIEGRRVEYEPVLSNEPDSPQGHDQFPYARFVDARDGNYVEPDYMSYSDYGGSTVERSNVRVFMEQFSELQGTEWWHLYGGHGTSAIVVRRDADERHPELGEFFDALESYPLANESDHSELEMNLEDEAWQDYGLSDFRRWLERLEHDERFDLGRLFNCYWGGDNRGIGRIVSELPHETQLDLIEAVLEVDLENVDDESDEKLNDIWWNGVRNGTGEEVRHEDAVNVYFDFPRGVCSYIAHTVGPSALKVALDALLATGGEWTPVVDQILQGARKPA